MRLVGFLDDSIVALIEGASGGGRASDPAAPRNAPAITPEDYLDQVAWHSSFFQYELLVDTVVTVNHASLAGNTFSLGLGVAGVASNVLTTDTVLYTHNLGYKPICFVIYDDIVLQSGTLIQVDASSRYRTVAMYVTSSVVGIRSIAYTDGSALSAASRDYRVVVCRNPEADPLLPLFGSDSGHIMLGGGKVNTANRYARKPAVGEPNIIKIDLGRTVDVRGGWRRVVSGGTTTSASGYTGSFTGGEYVEMGFGA